MEARPRPPDAVTDFQSYSQSHASSPEDWYEFCRQSHAYAEQAEAVINSLRMERDRFRTLHEYQISQQTELQTRCNEAIANEARAQSNEAHALRLALPTVTTHDTSSPEKPTEYVSVPRHPTPPPTASSTATSTRISEKVPDPDKFKGERNDLRRFSSQIHAKMTTNADRFPTSIERMVYVTSRLEGPHITRYYPTFEAEFLISLIIQTY